MGLQRHPQVGARGIESHDAAHMVEHVLKLKLEFLTVESLRKGHRHTHAWPSIGSILCVLMASECKSGNQPLLGIIYHVV